MSVLHSDVPVTITLPIEYEDRDGKWWAHIDVGGSTRINGYGTTEEEAKAAVAKSFHAWVKKHLFW